ncbi:hypothetical protein [Methylobacterium sp. J-092]|uniref:hypothetical protein n=1 Tax=Methylobacterium sp. J-092 TaxID=2836667 RepID=UPI001FBA50CF|nr:hypothetical protein [Methylobacterium sp. J-092]MCJ2007408.1 hypothetical protein [Methylobacterium sp. J-092]
MAEIQYLLRRDAAGLVDGFHVSVQDVTDHHRVEAMLRSAKAELEVEVAACTADRDEICACPATFLDPVS